MPIKPGFLISGDFPDSEESKNMIDSEGIEIFAHFPQALFPPPITILGHLIPIICREPPILAISGESIWRRSCLGIEIE